MRLRTLAKIVIFALLLAVTIAPTSARNIFDYPAAIAYGSQYVCFGAEFEWVGADNRFEGDIHSNGDFEMNGNASSPAEMIGTVTAGGDNDSDPNKVTYDADGDGIFDEPEDLPITGVNPSPFSLLVDLDYYNPDGDGRIYNALRNHPNGQANVVYGDWDMSILPSFVDEHGNPQTELEGLYFVTGDTQDNSPTIGAEGITIVSLTGQITISGFDGHYYEKLPLIPASDYRTYPTLLFATEYNNGGICGSGLSGTGIFVNGSNADIRGIMYTPYAGLNLSFSVATITGGLYAWVIDVSGSDITFTYDPSLLHSYGQQDLTGIAYATPGVCPQAEYEWSGANAYTMGNIHSNGDFEMTGNVVSPAEVEGIVTVGGDDLTEPSKVIYDADGDGIFDEPEDLPDENADPIPFTPLVDLDYYNPDGDGRIWHALRNHPQGQANVVYGDWDMSILPSFVDENGNPQSVLEGLYFVTGDTMANNPIIGAEGITIVSLTGQIKVSRFEGDFYEKLLTIPALDGRTYPALLFATEYDVTALGCPSGASGAGVFVNASNRDLHGIFYVPYARLEVNFSSAAIYGAVYGYTVEGSGSNLALIAEPTLLETRNYDLNGDGWLTPTDVLFIINRFGLTPTGANAVADVDDNGTIDAADASLLLSLTGW